MTDQPAERTFTFTLTATETEIVGRGLLELPGRVGNPLIGKIQGQINAQLKAAPGPQAIDGSRRGRRSKRGPRATTEPPAPPLAQQA